MKIRLMGTVDECRQVAGRLPSIVEVLEVSEPRENRGASRMVRVYAECRAEYAPPGTGGTGTPELPSGQEHQGATL